MNIIINNKIGTPIYEQVYTQIKKEIMSENLISDEPLPSIRSLAKDLRISVITTKRAYDELEKDGLIYTVAGKGCFVAAKNLELIREQNLLHIEEYIKKISELARQCRIKKSEIHQMIDLVYEEI